MVDNDEWVYVVDQGVAGHLTSDMKVTEIATAIYSRPDDQETSDTNEARIIKQKIVVEISGQNDFLIESSSDIWRISPPPSP